MQHLTQLAATHRPTLVELFSKHIIPFNIPTCIYRFSSASSGDTSSNNTSGDIPSNNILATSEIPPSLKD
ncbi:hypothetical protein RCL_jg9175.t1 [Rhizophagus clarus]|uniref:Uncharacterized protein n=1 Tax=Rhizophagus clarus TaxID=94130 RepID=A0A8H3R096_9GLOM|nr:hypothetical protein RCL_jg9175.t1 [Rhizophagus clarus]